MSTTTLTDKCAGCGAELSGQRFCGACGERKLGSDDYSLLHFFEHALHEVTSVDAKALRSAWALLARPGFLTSEFLAGRRRQYLKPMTVFVLTNAAFFLISYRFGLFHTKLTGFLSGDLGSLYTPLVARKAAALGLTAEQFGQRFDQIVPDIQRLLFFFSMPALAAVLAPIFRRRYFVEHLVYSTHFHAFFLLFTVIWLPLLFIVFGLVAYAGWLAPFQFFTKQGVMLPLLAGMAVYHGIAIPKVYGMGRAGALALAVVLPIAVVAFWQYGFRPLSFFAAFALV